MKVAITHDWLIDVGGPERVLEQLLRLYPEADVFTTVDRLPQSQRGFLQGARVFPSFLQGLPFSATSHRKLLPLMPLAMEQFELHDYDLVISNSRAVARGILPGVARLHLSYTLSPMSFAWDFQGQYLREQRAHRGVRSLVARSVLYHLRMWDHAASSRPDRMLAVSREVARRVETCYGLEAPVVYPPVDVDYWTPGAETAREDFFLVVCNLLPSKRVDLIVDAFALMPNRRLVVVGDGPELGTLRARRAPNVTFVGRQPDEMVREHMRRARALVCASVEEFRLAMAEAQACGTPVIALGRGGALEIVHDLGEDSPTGHLFSEQSVPAIRAAIARFDIEREDISPRDCRENAELFSADRFGAAFAAHVQVALSDQGRGSTLSYSGGGPESGRATPTALRAAGGIRRVGPGSRAAH